MSVRPPPSISTVSARRSTGIGDVAIFSMMLPRTRTYDGSESTPDFPSKMRTFEKIVTVFGASCACAGHAARIARTGNRKLGSHGLGFLALSMNFSSSGKSEASPFEMRYPFRLRLATWPVARIGDANSNFTA